MKAICINNNSKVKNNKQTKIWFWTALISSWLTFIFFIPIGFLFLIFWFVSLTILLVHRTKLKWFLIGLSAWTVIPVLSFLKGSKDYFTGQGTILYVGFPTTESFNLDSTYRVWNTSSGCIFFGYEPFTHFPNNFAIKFLTKLLGFQKEVYKGYYPDTFQTETLIDSIGQTTNFTKSRSMITFSLNNEDYNLIGFNYISDSCKTAKIAIFNEELIIFSVDSTYYLADYKTGNIFARYNMAIQEREKDRLKKMRME